MSTVAVDFDGVIHAYTRGWQDGAIYDEPVPGAMAALEALMADYAVFVHTTRDAEPVAEWLTGHGVNARAETPAEQQFQFWNGRDCVLVTSRKLAAVAYIDDRGIRFTSWEQALADLERYEPAR